ncbi:uncharacterized protein LOC131935427 [Physella acuta]|uniref:uncharacterized protein LOC131935427 n=1 Tax=Physella acuta TaxID=109671 RepID=UPI0027DBBC29|nr:uncharacterized protein LOC131935427 [Physella acuta]
MAVPTRFDYTVKIILLGDPSVGKSSLLNSLAQQQESKECRCVDYRPNGHVELAMARGGKRILAKIVDTGGQERFRSITASFYRGALGCFLMFDAEKVDTFRHVQNWHNDLDMYTCKQPMSIFLLGINTQSTKRQVTPEQAERLASQLEVQFHEVTLARRSNAVEVVFSLLDKIIIHASRLPSVTVDILPYQVQQHLAEKAALASDDSRKKFHCAC